MLRAITATLALAIVGAISWASAPREASASDLAMIGGHDTGGQGVDANCTSTATHNCNWPGAAGQCDKDVPYCILEFPSSKTCGFLPDGLHPCQAIPPTFPACAHRHHVNCTN